jgi:hypothetical protein
MLNVDVKYKEQAFTGVRDGVLYVKHHPSRHTTVIGMRNSKKYTEAQLTTTAGIPLISLYDNKQKDNYSNSYYLCSLLQDIVIHNYHIYNELIKDLDVAWAAQFNGIFFGDTIHFLFCLSDGNYENFIHAISWYYGIELYQVIRWLTQAQKDTVKAWYSENIIPLRPKGHIHLHCDNSIGGDE